MVEEQEGTAMGAAVVGEKTAVVKYEAFLTPRLCMLTQSSPRSVEHAVDGDDCNGALFTRAAPSLELAHGTIMA